MSLLEYPDYDIIVLDQSDDLQQVDTLNKIITISHINCYYIHSSLKGKSNSLNQLLNKASGSIFALTDDDTVVPPHWLQDIVCEFNKYPDIDILFGQVQPLLLDDNSDKLCIPGYQFDRLIFPKTGNVDGMGANLAIRSSLLKKVNKYDPLLGPGAPMPAAEEGDFIYRAQLAGAKVMHDPNVKLFHFGGRTPEEWGKLYFSYGCGDAGFAVKHLRCGDTRIMRRMLRNCLIMYRRYAIRCLHKGRHDELLYLKGFLKGLKLGYSYPINKKERLYVDKDPCS
jgi:cellulose synthase/poly-beta-1,6-N-acetylglucosamine synthase-like glycosyltransferase